MLFFCLGVIVDTCAGVILAAGRSVRMKSKVPKVLHQVAGREVIRYVADAISATGVAPLVVVAAPSEASLLEILGPVFLFVTQSEPLGTAHALWQAASLLQGKTQHVLVVHGDTPLISPQSLEGVRQIHQREHAAVTLLTCVTNQPEGLGRILRSDSGRIQAIVEEKEATAAQKAIQEVNAAVYCFRAEWLWANLHCVPQSPVGEYYLTDLVALAVQSGQPVASFTSDHAEEALGINTRLQLAQAEAIVRQRIREKWMLNGVTMVHPPTTFIDHDVSLGSDTIIFPNTFILGRSVIGEDCLIGPNSTIVNSIIGNGCKIVGSVVEGSRIEDGVDVGPFSHIRPESHIEVGVHIGNFAEIKKSRLGSGTKMGHFSYVGDATVGKEVNIGAGTITCNYDGVQKYETLIGDRAFIGSDSLLIAPVEVGADAVTGAGAVVNHNVPADSLAVGVPARILKKKRREGTS